MANAPWKTAIKNIYDRILEASDTTLQRKLWLNEKNDEELISSYDELMCNLFDDYAFDEFIDNKASEYGFAQKIIQELDELRKLLNNYTKKPNDVDIINDPEWIKITNQAKVCIKNWKL